MKHSSFARCIAVAFGLILLFPPGARAETEIGDNFGLKDRGAGLPLNGTATETGDVLWQASKNVVVNGSQESGYLSLADHGPFVARVSLPGSAEVISVEAALHVARAKEETDNWLAVGIGNPQMGNPAWGPGVYVHISSSGLYGCAFNPNPEDWQSKETVGITRGRVSEYDADGLTRVKLEYRVADQCVTVWINDEQVCENLKIPGDGVPVDPAFAGISGFSQKPNVRAAGGFVVKVTP